MTGSFFDLLFGTTTPPRDLVEASEPSRSFDDVILPAATRRALDHALLLIRKRDLILTQWGLGERHDTGLGLAFNFAGPPGTGKTICAEAIARELGRRLLVVRYSEMESMWAGQTAKYVAAVFESAARQSAVLFFDEADAIASRRFTGMSHAYEREANAIVNVLLHELERFPGVVIFATNLAVNLDPAFERRIRTHILFEMPAAEDRERIWKVQLHPSRTPLAADVDFPALAQRFEVSGGHIKNAVLKAAQIAAAEPGPDGEKKIRQRHFEQGMTEVLAAERVMQQSLYETEGAKGPVGAEDRLGELQQTMQGEMGVLLERVEASRQKAETLAADVGALRSQLSAASEGIQRKARALTLLAGGALIAALIALLAAVLR